MLQIIYMYTVVLHVALPAVLFFLYGQDQSGALAPSWSDLATDPLAIGLVIIAALAIFASLKIPSLLTAAGKDPKIAYIVKVCTLELCVLSGFVLGMIHKAPMFCVPFAAVGLAMVLKAAPPKT